MLATLVDEPFDEPGWLYEVKWDGYRALGYINDGTVEIRSRNNKSFNQKFYSLHSALQQWKINAVVDGEIIVVNQKGIADFSDLQGWRSEADGELVYYLFDVLWLDGMDLMQLSLMDRREMLKFIAPDLPGIRISETFDAGAKEFFEVAKKMELEGMIAKRSDSLYTPDLRSKEWLKIKTEKHQEAVIAGYTRNENTSRQFSALLLGLYENGEFQFIGPVGTGFTNKMQTEILQKLKPLETSQCPFKVVPNYNKPSRFRPDPPKAEVTWVNPELVAEITFQELTKDGSIRHPSFKGLREDKKALEVVREKEIHTSNMIEQNKDPLNKKLFTAAGKKERKTLLNPKDEMQTRNIDGHDLKFNNLSKIYYPEVKGSKAVTKRDVINYYYQVAPYMLPYMKDRPQTLIRYPNGIEGESFYQKDVTGKVPEWIQQFPYSSEAGGNRNFLVCTDEASLLLIASIGGLEMHPWSSRVQKPNNPDWCIIDLDPSDTTTFEQVIKAAQTTKEVLDAIEVPAYCKTSGATGIHIYIPLGAKYTYEQSKEFGRVLVKIVHGQIPKFTTIERIIENRKGNMYLDFLQNRPQATLAAPYSLRPKPGATVSMPLHWDEVKKGLKMKHFTIFNAVERVKEQGDIFSGVLAKGINLKQVLKKMENVFGKQEMHESLRS
ncbi:MAG: DNA ligase D [Chitinophagales bacterium]|nr:DNA ligase D [Chitinophagales bacterium]